MSLENYQPICTTTTTISTEQRPTLKRRAPSPHLTRPTKHPPSPNNDFPKNIFAGYSYVSENYQADRENEEIEFHQRIPETQPPEISEMMRGILIDWLIQVTDEFNLPHHVLFLATNYIDRLLRTMRIERSGLQLVGITCLFIASKFEGETVNTDDFVLITDGAYVREQLLYMERVVLQTLEYRLVSSTVATFLPLYLEIEETPDLARVGLYARYVAELLLPFCGIQLKYRPSQIAASIVSVSKNNFGISGKISPNLEIFTKYCAEDIWECVLDIRNIISNPGRFRAAWEKYSKPKYAFIAIKHN